LKDGQKDLPQQHAKEALALLDSHSAPASSWTHTKPYRGEIRRGAQQVLKMLGAAYIDKIPSASAASRGFVCS